MTEQAAQRFDDGLEFTLQFIDDDAQFLIARFDDDDVFTSRRLAGNGEKFAQTQKRQNFTTQIEIVALGRDVFQFQTFDHHFQRNHISRRAGGYQETVNDGESQWQADSETSALAFGGINVHRAAQRLDIASHHIHAHTPAGKIGDGFCRGKTGFKNQVLDFAVTEILIVANQPALDCFGQNSGAVKPGTIIADFDDDVARIMKSIEQQPSSGGFSLGQTLLWRFQTMIDGVTHQMHQWIGNFFHH